MIHPSYSELIQAINSDLEEDEAPLVNSRYSVVLATSRRARQIVSGALPYVKAAGRKPLSVAVDEMYEGLVHIIPDDPAVESAEAGLTSEQKSED